MALTFPSSPTNGQVYTDTITGNRYIYDSAKGFWKFSSNNVGMSVSSTPPSNVGSGSMWYNREIGRTFVYYNDGDSSQWVETVPAGSIDTSTIASYVNPIYASLNTNWSYTNTAYTFANIAVNTANTAFPNTPNVSFNGSFNVPNGAVSIGTNSYPVGKFHVSTSNGEIARYTATGASGGYNVLFIDNTTPWYIGSAKSTIAGNINDLYIGSGPGTTNNLIFGVSGTERVRISNTGLGIGTTNPLARMHIAVPNGYSSNGSARFTVNANTILSYHISSTSYGGSSNSTFQYGLSFGAGGAFGVGSGTQSAIAISENGADGTAIGFFTTNNYAGGPNLNMAIDPGGRVTRPNQPFFMGSPTTDYSGGSMPTQVMAVTSLYNNGNHFNGSTNRFTCPVNGWYRVTWGGLQLGTTVTSLQVNGSDAYNGNHGVFTGSYITMTQTVLRSFNAGDYLTIRQWNGGGYYSGWWLWSVELVG
jgi:hypothetical protein